MSEEKTDWNAEFKERMAEHLKAKAERLAKAKEAAKGTGKEPYSRRRFKQLYIKLRPHDVDKYTPWETLLEESEYEYYVMYPDHKTLEQYIKYQDWVDGYA